MTGQAPPAAATHIAVSFLNLTTPGRASLGLLDLGSFVFRAVDLPPEIPRSNGITGMARDGSLVYVVLQSPPAVLALDKADLSLRWRHDFAFALDVHSILVRDNLLYAVSAGTDEILELVVEGDGIRSERVLWRADSQGPRADIHHLKSICETAASLANSGIGKKDGAGWSTAVDGFIHDIGSGRSLATGLRNPHSLVDLDGTIAYCESRSRSVRVLGDERAASLPGYTRGLCVAGEHLYAGTSARRRISKSTGRIEADERQA